LVDAWRFPGRTVAIFVGVVATAWLAACGGGDDTERPAVDPVPQETRDAAAAYVGMTKADAITAAVADGRPWRIGREDDEQFLLTQDFVENRVTFEIDDGKVTAAKLG
jgi:hypothetical protein